MRYFILFCFLHDVLHPDDLDDDDVRQKIHDQLGDIQPLLEDQ